MDDLMILSLLQDIFEVIFQFLIMLGPLFGPLLLGAMIIIFARKHSILAFIMISGLSALFNIIIWIFPNHTTALAAGNQILNLATIQNVIDLIIYSEMSSWAPWINILILPASIILSLLYFKFFL